MTLASLFGLDGQTALITGATGGIGSAMSRAFAAAGARLVLASNDVEACAALGAELKASGADVLIYPCDVSDASQLTALADAAEEFGPVDILLCNAGIAGPHGPLAATSDDDYTRLFEINLQHPLRLTSRLAAAMATRGHGSIVLTASIAGMRGNAGVGLYGLAKAALMQLARNLAVEHGPRGVRANAIAPGLIATGWADAILASPSAAARRLALTPLRRVGDPREVATAALFLAGPGASFITGATIVVDGGTLITDGN